MLDHMLDLNYKKYKLHTTKLQNTVQQGPYKRNYLNLEATLGHEN